MVWLIIEIIYQGIGLMFDSWESLLNKPQKVTNSWLLCTNSTHHLMINTIYVS